MIEGIRKVEPKKAPRCWRQRRAGNPDSPAGQGVSRIQPAESNVLDHLIPAGFAAIETSAVRVRRVQ
jgi:hypothetical protein